jgi:hypothetical protein
MNTNNKKMTELDIKEHQWQAWLARSAMGDNGVDMAYELASFQLWLTQEAFNTTTKKTLTDHTVVTLDPTKIKMPQTDLSPFSETTKNTRNAFVPFSQVTEWDSDQRPQRTGWATGLYTCTCLECGKGFMGAKRSWNCAPCAYGDEKPDQGVQS